MSLNKSYVPTRFGPDTLRWGPERPLFTRSKDYFDFSVTSPSGPKGPRTWVSLALTLTSSAVLSSFYHSL